MKIYKVVAKDKSKRYGIMMGDGITECAECNEDLRDEYVVCINGMLYGPCDYQDEYGGCGGACVIFGNCDCECHASPSDVIKIISDSFYMMHETLRLPDGTYVGNQFYGEAYKELWKQLSEGLRYDQPTV